MENQNNFKGEQRIKEKGKTNKMVNYVYAYDPRIQRRVAHVVKKGMAISLITGNRFKYSGPVSSTRDRR